jgi:rubredoxin
MAAAHHPKWYGGRGTLGICDNGGLRRNAIEQNSRRFNRRIDAEEPQRRREVLPCRCGGTVVLEINHAWRCRRCGMARGEVA